MLFCGSFTNTPALASVVEAIKRAASEDATTLSSEPVFGYKVVEMLGEISNIAIDMDRSLLDFTRIFVSNKNVVEVPITPIWCQL